MQFYFSCCDFEGDDRATGQQPSWGLLFTREVRSSMYERSSTRMATPQTLLLKYRPWLGRVVCRMSAVCNAWRARRHMHACTTLDANIYRNRLLGGPALVAYCMNCLHARERQTTCLHVRTVTAPYARNHGKVIGRRCQRESWHARRPFCRHDHNLVGRDPDQSPLDLGLKTPRHAWCLRHLEPRRSYREAEQGGTMSQACFATCAPRTLEEKIRTDPDFSAA